MRSVRSVLLVLVLVEASLVILATGGARLTWTPMRITGIGFLALGLGWVAVARFHLGKSFSVTPQARQLITTGLYSRIRNPIYLATPVLLIGLSLLLASWWPMLLSIVLVPMQIFRAHREAQVLRAAFGAEYDRYRARTWF